MRYILKVTNFCQDWGITGIYYWIAENEPELKAMLSLECETVKITCLGPETELGYTLRNKVKTKIEQADAPEPRITAARPGNS